MQPRLRVDESFSAPLFVEESRRFELFAPAGDSVKVSLVFPFRHRGRLGRPFLLALPVAPAHSLYRFLKNQDRLHGGRDSIVERRARELYHLVKPIENPRRNLRVREIHVSRGDEGRCSTSARDEIAAELLRVDFDQSAELVPERRDNRGPVGFVFDQLHFCLRILGRHLPDGRDRCG
jgi:hypothetical protein